MSEPDEHEVRQELRAMLADRIGALRPPVGVYQTVRRRHQRRQRAVVGGAVVLAAAAVAGPSIAVAQRPAAGPGPATGTPAADGSRCELSGRRPAPAREQLPAQRTVPGSLGGDAALVAAVLRTGWSMLRADDGSRLDPATARVKLAERVEGQVVGLVGASGQGGRELADTWVWGPDADHLVGETTGAAVGPVPLRTPYAIGDALVQGRQVCGVPYLFVLAPPGTTGRADWVGGFTPGLEAVGGSRAVPLRPDGTAAFRLDAPDVRIRLTRAGRTFYDLGPQTDHRDRPAQPTKQDLDRAVADAPGDGDPAKVRSIVELNLGAARLPTPATDPRVLWTGRTASGWSAMVGAMTLPGGVRYVASGTTDVVDRSVGYYFGLLAPGQLERTVLAWGDNRRGRPLIVFAVGGVRAEAVLAGGGVTPFALSGGGGMLESGEAVRRVRVYGPGDTLIGEQVPGRGLTPVPLAAPR